MDFLGPYVLAEIAQHLCRHDCVMWSRCSSRLHAQLMELCNLRLTEQQSVVVEKVVSLDSAAFQEHLAGLSEEDLNRYKAKLFPPAYTVASGPSTGKTAIALYCAAKLQRRGKRVFLLAPMRLCPQWRSEHAKFAERFHLPPLCIAHPRFDADWLARMKQGAIPLLPKEVLTARCKDIETTSPIVRTQETFLEQSWDIGLLDEAPTIPRQFFAYARKRNKRGLPFHLVSFNASCDGASCDGPALAQHSSDAQLGRLPQVASVVCSRPLDLFPSFVREHCGQKTLVVSNDPHFHTLDFQEFYPPDQPLFDLVHVNSQQRAQLLTEFAAAPKGLLAARLDYVVRGFNFGCDTVIALDEWGQLSAKSLQQLLGRVMRVDSPFSLVNLYVYQRVALRGQQLGFHALALSGLHSTSDLLRQAEWFAGEPRMICRNGKRQKLDRALAIDTTPEGRWKLFKQLFPREAQHVVSFTAEQLVVRSKIE